jgi:hypothetical protein
MAMERGSFQRVVVSAALVTVVGVMAVPRAEPAIPYFARQYGVTCAQCHVSPPKLNAFGEEFRARGYRMGAEPRRTLPLAVWVSGRGESVASDGVASVAPHVNRVELISGGEITSWLSYFVEWRVGSLESRADGTLRDRSGRLEDLFLVGTWGGLDVMAGQFRQVDQVDVSLRLGLSEPLSLSTGLPGFGEGSARQRSLRGFSPSARSPAVRVSWTESGPGGWRWTTSASVPFPGELSIPLTREAREEASNEVEWNPKGVVVESYARRGVSTLGLHAFYDHGDRYLLNGVATGNAGRFYWAGIGGARRSGGALLGQWSLEGEYLPYYFAGLGTRVEGRAGDGTPPAVVPYLNLHFPGTRWTSRLTVEQRIGGATSRTLVELGAIF